MSGFEELYERVKGAVRNIEEGIDKESMLDVFDYTYNEDNFIEQAMGDEEAEEFWRDMYQDLEHHIRRARQALVKLVNSDVSGEDIPTCWWEGRDAWRAMDEQGIDDYLGGLVKAEKELLSSAPGAGEAPEEYPSVESDSETEQDGVDGDWVPPEEDPSSEVAVRRAKLSQKMFGKSPKDLTGTEAAKVYRELGL